MCFTYAGMLSKTSFVFTRVITFCRRSCKQGIPKEMNAVVVNPVEQVSSAVKVAYLCPLEYHSKLNISTYIKMSNFGGGFTTCFLL